MIRVLAPRSQSQGRPGTVPLCNFGSIFDPLPSGMTTHPRLTTSPLPSPHPTHQGRQGWMSRARCSLRGSSACVRTVRFCAGRRQQPETVANPSVLSLLFEAVIFNLGVLSARGSEMRNTDLAPEPKSTVIQPRPWSEMMLAHQRQPHRPVPFRRPRHTGFKEHRRGSLRAGPGPSSITLDLQPASDCWPVPSERRRRKECSYSCAAGSCRPDGPACL